MFSISFSSHYHLTFMDEGTDRRSIVRTIVVLYTEYRFGLLDSILQNQAALCTDTAF